MRGPPGLSGWPFSFDHARLTEAATMTEEKRNAIQSFIYHPTAGRIFMKVGLLIMFVSIPFPTVYSKDVWRIGVNLFFLGLVMGG
jgi:hypothetical protein